MKARTMNCILIGLLSLALAWPCPVFAQSGQAAADGRVTLDFRDVELTDLVQTISELTGRNFLYDETVKGKVTIVSPDSMTLDEAYRLFQTVLAVKGFTIVPSGKVNKIVPVKNAKEANLPTLVDGQTQSSEQFITRLVRLQHLDAAAVATSVLAPLLPASGNVVAYPPTNTLIMTESAANIERLVRILRELDQPGSSSTLEVLPLRHADAEELARIFTEILDQSGPAQARRVRRANTAVPSQEVPSKVIAYKRTNSLIIVAGAEDLELVKGLVTSMDQAVEGQRSNINLYYLENADADTLAGTLNEILTGISAQARQQARDSKTPQTIEAVTITADKPTNSLVINASPEDYETLRGIIRQLDIKRKQVYVEALIMELSMDATQRLGVSLQGAGAVDDDGVIIGNSNFNNQVLNPLSDDFLLSRAVDGLLAGGFFNPITVTAPDGSKISVPSLSVLINLSKTDGDVNILSAPRLLTSDNEEAEIIVGSNVPIITGRVTDTGSSGLAQSVTVERQDVALVLRFTPQITSDDLVRLNVYQEMTDIVPGSKALTDSVGSPSQVGPTFTKRVLRNTVLAENGKTVVLGGLIGTNVSESVTKVPLLGDIPLLGWLFKSKSTTEKKTNLLVFINPTVIRGPEDLARVTGRNHAMSGSLMNDKTRSALPQDFFLERDGSLSPLDPGSAAIIPVTPPVPVIEASAEGEPLVTPQSRRDGGQ